MDSIIALIKEICYEEEIKATTRMSSLNIDSLAFVELLIKLENRFDIEFSSDQLVIAAYRTVGDLADCVLNKINRKGIKNEEPKTKR